MSVLVVVSKRQHSDEITTTLAGPSRSICFGVDIGIGSVTGKEPKLTGLTLWECLDDNHPGDYPYKLLRTLQEKHNDF